MLALSILICILATCAADHSNLHQNLTHASSKENPPLRPEARSCSLISVERRVDCLPAFSNGNQNECEKRGCCWASYSGSLSNVPWCFYPTSYPTYTFTNTVPTPTGVRFDAVRSWPSHYPNNVMRLKGEITEYAGGITRVKFWDPAKKRYEIPIPLNFPPAVRTYRKAFNIEFANSSRSIRIIDKRTGSVKSALMDGAPLIFAEQFLQISISLDGTHVYGVGERYGDLMLDATKGWGVTSIWATDRAPGIIDSANFGGGNMYGAHPFALVMNDQGGASGIAFLNSNAMQVVVHPAPAITFRSIGGIIDLVIFNGDAPSGSPTYPLRIVQQYWSLINGGRPVQQPPYWALGFHLCRWGYFTDSTLEYIINSNLNKGMPYDTQWVDIDYMHQKMDWTYDKQNFSRLPQIVNDLHARNMRFVPIVDPAIHTKSPYSSYDRGNQMDVFIKYKGAAIEGEVWPGKTVFPDFTNPATKEWWYLDGNDFFKDIKFDGLWIDMNEPANFKHGNYNNKCTDIGEPGNEWDNPPFQWQNFNEKTICMSSQQKLDIHYNIHNLYGYYELIATYEMLQKLRPGERPFILSRSTFMGSGAYGNHWTGDVQRRWFDLELSTPSVVMFGLFGIPLVGADICGFGGGETTEELCIRWMQVGSFYPFMRNHNDWESRRQDPASWSDFAFGAMRSATEIRYSLLPYLYTLFYRAHAFNEMVAVPLGFVSPMDKTTHPISNQFMWGDGLLITPVVKQGARNVWGYFPASTLPDSTRITVWYELRTGARVVGGAWVDLPAPLEFIPLHVRGGSILPMQTHAQNTVLARKNTFQLLVALSRDSEGFSWNGVANGSLYMDDSISQNSVSSGKYSYITFSANRNTVSSRVVKAGYNPEVDGASRGESGTLDKVTMFGIQSRPSSAAVDGVGAIQVSYSQDKMVAEFSGFRIKLVQPFTLRINY